MPVGQAVAQAGRPRQAALGAIARLLSGRCQATTACRAAAKARSCLPARGPRRPASPAMPSQVALLFLTHGDLPHDEVWTAWVREARGLLPRSSLAGEQAFCLQQCNDAGEEAARRHWHARRRRACCRAASVACMARRVPTCFWVRFAQCILLFFSQFALKCVPAHRGMPMAYRGMNAPLQVGLLICTPPPLDMPRRRRVRAAVRARRGLQPAVPRGAAPAAGALPQHRGPAAAAPVLNVCPRAADPQRLQGALCLCWTPHTRPHGGAVANIAAGQRRAIVQRMRAQQTACLAAASLPGAGQPGYASPLPLP